MAFGFAGALLDNIEKRTHHGNVKYACGENGYPTGTTLGRNQLVPRLSFERYFIGAKFPYWWDGGIPMEG